MRPGLPALLIGSHIDTVRNGGRFDGALGVALGIGVAARLAARNARLPFALEVLAFGDEEGVRFPGTLSGSKAVAGRFDPRHLKFADAEGVTFAKALAAFGGDPKRIASIARGRADVLGYFEAHIEQGPVLEKEGLPVGIVTGIAAARRWTIRLTGMAGHAGTVPMAFRRDALAGAAEMLVAIERMARRAGDVVATVGTFAARPGARNVIPGEAEFSLDFRSLADRRLDAFARRARRAIDKIADARGLSVAVQSTYAEFATPCHSAFQSGLAAAIRTRGLRAFSLPSGAGHDGLSFRGFCPVGMLFLRCKGGISHHPAESVTAKDVQTALDVIADFVINLQPGALARSAPRRNQRG
jgi:allantoate deiminase